MEKEIVYEPHPVSPERKAELRAKGVIILDAIFKPVDTDEPTQDDTLAVETKKRGRPAKE
jgi:hypothetical protein